LNLFSRLLLAHTLPIALVSVALGLTLLALTRMTGLLQEVTDVNIRTLKLESDVHHATWQIDISLGHVYAACQTGQVPECIATLRRQPRVYARSSTWHRKAAFASRGLLVVGWTSRPRQREASIVPFWGARPFAKNAISWTSS
jgi:hypothetical protein